MATAADRKGFVQTLRRGARSHEVPLVADNAARDKVKTKAETLLALDTLEEDERAQLELAWSSYKASWPD